MSLGRVYKKGKVYLEIELYSYSRHVERDYQLKREVRGIRVEGNSVQGKKLTF